MWFRNLKFNPIRDQKPVDKVGFIDLKSALVNSVVPSNLPDSDSDYNGIDDPESILGTPHDIFEALDMQDALQDVSSSSAESDDSGNS